LQIWNKLKDSDPSCDSISINFAHSSSLEKKVTNLYPRLMFVGICLGSIMFWPTIEAMKRHVDHSILPQMAFCFFNFGSFLILVVWLRNTTHQNNQIWASLEFLSTWILFIGIFLFKYYTII